jgi:hypothetical protein
MRRLLWFDLLMLVLFVNGVAVAKSPLSTEKRGKIVVDDFILGDANVFLPALPGTESIALYRITAYPEAVFSLTDFRKGVTMTADGRLVISDAAAPGEVDIRADVGTGQSIRKKIRLEIPYGAGVDMVRPEWVPEINLPTYLQDPGTYRKIRYTLLLCSFVMFAIYVYGRRRIARRLAKTIYSRMEK